MQTLTAPAFRPWGSTSSTTEYQESVCCWNLCPSFSVDMKQPRSYSARRPAATNDRTTPITPHSADGNNGSRPWAAVAAQTPSKKPFAADAAPAAHLTHRLLVETVGPGRHVIFNPLSGAVDLADDEDLRWLDALRRGAPVSLAPDQEAELRRRLYLFDNPAEEEACLDSAVTRAWSRMESAQPQMYTLCPTLACNLACGYCFEGDSLTDKAQGVMTEEQVTQAFAAIESLRAQYDAREEQPASAPWISLFGGEPLLPSTRRAVAHILRLAAENGFLVCATTNGVNLTRYEDLLTEYADILTIFQVTLDGPKAVHDARRHRLGGQGTFDEIVRGIDLLLFLGIDVDLRVNLDGANVDALPELVDFIHEKGWHNHPAFELALAPVTMHGEEGGCRSRYDKALSELELARRVMALTETYPRVAEVCHLGFLRHLEYLVSVLEPEKMGRPGRRGLTQSVGPRYWYCEASTDKQYVFTPEGLLYSCTEAVGQPSHAVGRFDPHLDLWKAERGQWVGRTILSHTKCRSCAISTLCGGGCNIAARERADKPSVSLLQIALPGGKAGGAQRPLETARTPEPFCNAAEETVRAYLRAAGNAAFESKRPSLSYDGSAPRH